MPEREVEFIDIIRVLWRQKWVILATFVVAVGTAWVLSGIPDPIYQASTSLLLLPPLSSDLSASTDSSIPSAIYEELAVSTSVLQSILDSLDLELGSKHTLEQLSKEVTVNAMSYSTSAGGSPREQVRLRMSIKGSNPDELTAIAQAWIDAFTTIFGAISQDRTARSYNYILQNYEQTEMELANAVNERIVLLAEHALESMRVEKNIVQNRLTTVREELYAAQSEWETTQAYLASRSEASFRSPSQIILSDTIDPNTLSGALLFGLTAQQFQTLILARIETLQDETDQLRAELDTTQHTIDSTEASLNELDRQIVLLSESSVFLSSRLQSARLALVETPALIQVIDEPMASSNPISDRKIANVVIAGFLGLMLGALFAFMVDYLLRVREREEAAARAKIERLKDLGSKKDVEENY